MKNFILLHKLRLLLILILLPSLSPLWGQVIMSSCDQTDTDFLGERFEYFSSTKNVSFQEAQLHSFQKGKSKVLNFGLSDSIYWLHTKVVFQEACDKFIEFDSQGIDTLEVFIMGGGKLLSKYLLGTNINFNNWPLPSHKYAFPIKAVKGDTLEIYLKITSSQQLLVPVHAMSTLQYWSDNLKDNLVYGIYFGIVCVMIFYNLFLYFSVKDRNYLYYIGYIVFVGAAQASLLGYAHAYIWPDSQWLRVNGTVLTGALSGIFTLLFVINFLRTSTFTPILNKLLWLAIFVDIIALILLFSGFKREGFTIINSTAGFGSLIVMITAFVIVKKGYLPAKFFAVAYSFFLISVIVFVLKDYSILPYNEFTTKSMIYGSSFEIVLLSLALANRINVFRKEKEESAAEALRVSRENERIIREQNVFLEQKVDERTLELQEANEELTVTLANLRDTQTQLVDAEKMASLGQLTAGIAHEINNPINFVTSNIKPLKRDLDDLYEILDSYIAVEPGSEKVNEELKRAHELRDELEFEFVKEEISSLVNGISDGANRTSEIVKGLRTFSRLDEDVIKQVDIHEGIGSTLVLLRSKLKDQIEVVNDYDDKIPDVECFPGKLNQVFMNILGNGIYAVTHKKYNEGESPVLTIKTRLADNEVKIHLIDNGIGMDEQTMKKMFDPFFTTKDVGEGTGLGMSIVFKIIEKHRGTITVNSELGVGTEFIITLPLRQPNEFE